MWIHRHKTIDPIKAYSHLSYIEFSSWDQNWIKGSKWNQNWIKRSRLLKPRDQGDLWTVNINGIKDMQLPFDLWTNEIKNFIREWSSDQVINQGRSKILISVINASTGNIYIPQSPKIGPPLKISPTPFLNKGCFSLEITLVKQEALKKHYSARGGTNKWRQALFAISKSAWRHQFLLHPPQ